MVSIVFMSHKRIPDNFASEQRPWMPNFEEDSLDILTLMDMQESIKAKLPQLEFESKLYRILQGGGKNYMLSVLIILGTLPKQVFQYWGI